MKTILQKWYNDDKGKEIQDEIMELINVRWFPLQRGTKGEDIFTFFNSKELKLDVSLRRGGRGTKGEEVGITKINRI